MRLADGRRPIWRGVCPACASDLKMLNCFFSGRTRGMLVELANSITKDLNVLEASIGIDGAAREIFTRADHQSLGAEPSQRAVADVLMTIRYRYRKAVKRLKTRRRSDLDTDVDRYWRRLFYRGSMVVGTIAVLVGAIHGIRLAFASKISIVEATYGENCNGTSVGAGGPRKVSVGNATAAAKENCEGARKDCTIVVAANLFGDPGPFLRQGFPHILALLQPTSYIADAHCPRQRRSVTRFSLTVLSDIIIDRAFEMKSAFDDCVATASDPPYQHQTLHFLQYVTVRPLEKFV